MNTTDWWARGLALISVVMSVGGLGWNILVWRRGGARLRVNALAYRDVVQLWVFNGGRSPATIDEAVLGGRRGGVGGHDLKTALDLPVTLAAGESRRWQLPIEELAERRRADVAAGWESIWLLLGSMRQQRAEVLPQRRQEPPSTGWNLAPGTAKVSRWMPLAATLLLVVAAPPSPTGHDGSPAIPATNANITAMTLLILWTLGLCYTASISSWRSRRRDLERRAVYVAMALAVLAVADGFARPVVGLATVGFALGAVLLAWPSAIPAIRDQGRLVRDRAVTWLRARTWLGV